MNEQEKKGWIERNKENFSDEKEAVEYLENRISQEEAKESRVLMVFKNRDEFNDYANSHRMGKDWDFDSDDFDADEHAGYEDYVAICAYEYK